MARFFFHVRDSETYIDVQGTVLPDLRTARREAVRFAGALLTDNPDTFWQGAEWTMRVTDEADLTLFELTFFATEGASSVP
ncbi:DUF6894 family protein [Sphingomonas sp. TZW2008]|uniref:DUF6894 family protein n=1 Tax=Sphingomonas sp. TZW2008 TaxID=1917973 RepID=UPI000A26A096|nr:hypothetical protein [Sphingomonas sp. TZW2008]